MKNVLCISMLLLMTLFSSMAVTGQTLKADYQFQGNLNSSVAGAPALTSLTGSGGPTSFVVDTVDGYARQTLRFPFNSGVSLNITGLIPNHTYTFVGLFKFDDVSGFRRVGGGDPTDDGGAYILNGRLEFENTANAQFRQNHYIQVVVVREANGTVRAYRDGGFRVNAVDTDGDFIFTTNELRLFQDDINLPTEASAGNLARLRVYDGPLTTTQIRALDRVPNAIGGGAQPILFWSSRDGFSEIYTMNADGSNHRRLTNNEVSELGARWSPNGQRIVYFRRETNTSPYQVWVMNADGSGQTRLTNTTTNDSNPSWKPDGTKILFSRCDPSFVCDLYTMDPDGMAQAVLPPPLTTANDEDVGSYSPDGTKITFVCSISGSSFANQNICTANADGSNRQQITNTLSPILNSEPAYSPDNTKIAFSRRSNLSSNLTSEIFTMNADGNGQTQLTTNSFVDVGPVWSADGLTLAFSSEREAAFVEVYTMNATNGSSVTRLTTNSIADLVTNWYRPSFNRTPFDFDGDGRTDVSVFRPSANYWYIVNSSNNAFRAESFGTTGDRIVPADYDGDGKTDVAVWRPSSGYWYSLDSSSGAFRATVFGQNGDIPAPADFDGDGKSDICVFRPSIGTFYLLHSSDGSFHFQQWGQAGDVPVVVDYDGDGRADFGIYRDANSTFYYLRSSDGGVRGQQWGASGDKPITADVDADGKSDIAVYRPSTSAWYAIRSSDNSFAGVAWGIPGDIPAAGDYDGDGETDVAVFRPSSGVFYILESASGSLRAEQFGTSGDLPVPSAFVP